MNVFLLNYYPNWSPILCAVVYKIVNRLYWTTIRVYTCKHVNATSTHRRFSGGTDMLICRKVSFRFSSIMSSGRQQWGPYVHNGRDLKSYFYSKCNDCRINYIIPRQGRSTLYHLLRFETFIRNTFAKKGHAVYIFFDAEKAYCTTWK
jgi:hypothetical protein